MPSPRRGASEFRRLRTRLLRAGWLLDVNGSAVWEEYEAPSHRAPGSLLDQARLFHDARETAQRYRGSIVRLTRLPDGYRLSGIPAEVEAPHGSGEAPQALSERSWVVAVVSEGWPGGPALEPAWRLIGPLKLLQAVAAARERADGASS
jgi:hypothetical protein